MHLAEPVKSIDVLRCHQYRPYKDSASVFSSSRTVQGSGAHDYLKRVNKIIHCSLYLGNSYQQAVSSSLVTDIIDCAGKCCPIDKNAVPQGGYIVIYTGTEEDKVKDQLESGDMMSYVG